MSKTATVHAQQRWEYLEITRKTEGYLVAELNELGKVGWELVSVSFHKMTKSGLGDALAWTAFLKRPHAEHAKSPKIDGQTAADESPGAEAAVPSGPPEKAPAKYVPGEAGEDFDFKE